MTTDELKEAIEQRTSVPGSLLNGEDPTAILEQARQVLAMRAEQPKSPSEQFEEWFNGVQGKEPHDEAGAALAEIAEEVRTGAGGYPIIHDGGDPLANHGIIPELRSGKEQFSEWFWNESAFDPGKGPGGWKRLL